MSNPILFIWIGIMVAMVVIEIMTMGLTTIWFAGGAFVGLILAALKAPLWAQIVAALVVSGLLMFFTRPIAMKYFNKDRVLTNAEGLVGRKAIVKVEINNLQSKGQVAIDGQEWTARSSVDSEIIPVDSVVEIVSISGVKLMVKVPEDN